MAAAENIEQFLKGVFVTDKIGIQEKLPAIKAIIFDWDGVFNNGHKNIDGHSSFSETDSMGTNLMRFNQYLQKNQQVITAIITGENNQCAFNFAHREHFNAVYYKIKHKQTALLHLCKQYEISPDEVLFVFDDVLDFSAAKFAGIRVMVNHSCNPMLIEYAVKNKLVDYLTAHEGGYGAVREVSELTMCLSDRFDETIENRMQYSELYKKYIHDRNKASTEYYTIHNNEITLQYVL